LPPGDELWVGDAQPRILSPDAHKDSAARCNRNGRRTGHRAHVNRPIDHHSIRTVRILEAAIEGGKQHPGPLIHGWDRPGTQHAHRASGLRGPRHHMQGDVTEVKTQNRGNGVRPGRIRPEVRFRDQWNGIAG